MEWKVLFLLQHTTKLKIMSFFFIAWCHHKTIRHCTCRLRPVFVPAMVFKKHEESSQLLLLTEWCGPRCSPQFTGNRSQSAWKSSRNLCCSIPPAKLRKREAWKHLHDLLSYYIHYCLPLWLRDSKRFIGAHLPSEECCSESQRAVGNIYTSLSFSAENPYLITIC